MKKISLILLLFTSVFSSFAQSTGKIIGNKPSGYTISLDTINAGYTKFNLKQTTAGQTFTVANLVSGSKDIWIRNLGSVSVIIAPGDTLYIGKMAIMSWCGSSWTTTIVNHSTTGGGGGSFASITGSPYDNSNLSTALNTKVNLAGDTMSDNLAFPNDKGITWLSGNSLLTGSGGYSIWTLNDGIEVNATGDINLNAGGIINLNGNVNIDPSGTMQFLPLTASRALALNSSKEVVSSTTTDTELGYVHGVTSAIQTQLNAISGNGDSTLTLKKSNNFSDVPNKSTARTNLGVPAGSGSSTGTNTGDETTSRINALYGYTPANAATVTTNTANIATNTSAIALKAPIVSPAFTGTVTIPTPFTLAATSVTSTGTQLNYLNAATGTTGTASTNLVYSASPTLVTPNLGTPTTLVATNATGTASGLTAGSVTTIPTLSNEVSNVGNAITLINASVIGKVLTGYSSAAGTVAATDNILQAFQKLNGNTLPKADTSNVVNRTTAQAVAGVKTFSDSPIVPTPTTSTQVANKAYVDAAPRNLIVINNQVASYTLVLADYTTYTQVRINNAAATNLTIPPNASVAFPVGTQIELKRIGAGIMTVVAGAGVTVTGSAGNLADAGQNVMMLLTQVSANTWELENGAVGQWVAYVPTFTGFITPPSILAARYILVGKMCTVYFRGGSGTSNAITFTMTLPFAAANTSQQYFFAGYGFDNSSGLIGPVLIGTRVNSNIIDMYSNGQAAGWTASGTKLCNFSSFTYEIQ